jgi:6-phosphogluconolactonase/glucosamine-6-phosphate isomerase/deaminase
MRLPVYDLGHCSSRKVLRQCWLSLSNKRRSLFKLVLAGGTAPVKAYQLLATKQADWSKWHIYYGDERCLPIDDSERNSYLGGFSMPPVHPAYHRRQ